MRLFDHSHQKTRALLASGAPVYLSVNPVEYHGPHLPLHNDRLISAGIVREVHARMGGGAPLLEADDLEVGVEPAAGPGTRHTPFPIVRDLVREACRSLAELGATKVVLVTFHGAPLHARALEEGIELLTRRGVSAVAPFNLLMRELIEADGTRYADAFAHIDDDEEREGMIRNAALDFHAGFLETSLTLHFAPASVSPSYQKVPPCPPITPHAGLATAARLARRAGARELACELDTAAAAMGWHALRPFPGYTGRPHRATPAAGAIFGQHVVERFVAIIEDVFAGRMRSPAPVMAWSAALTMNGRFSPFSGARSETAPA
jgi:creatinine amidohydrolase